MSGTGTPPYGDGAELAPIPDFDAELGLAELVSRVLDRGVVLSGQAVVGVAGVDLLYLGLNLVLASVETLVEREAWDEEA